MDYLMHLGILACIYIILVMSFNISVGFTGLVNLAHIAAFGIGAYASALLSMNNLPVAVSFVFGAVIASFAGMILAVPAKKIKGDYLAMVTLGFTFIAASVSRNWISLTRGALGIPGIPRAFQNNMHYLVFALVMAILSYTLLRALVKSSFGKVFQAARDDEVAAMALGKNTFLYKIMAFGISSFFAGASGTLFAHYLTFVDPTIFALGDLVLIFSMLVVGGLASLEGSAIGAVLILLIPEPLKFIGFPPEVLGPLRDILFALILILILIYRPKGILGRVDLP